VHGEKIHILNIILAYICSAG